jgi:ribosomal protein S27E
VLVATKDEVRERTAACPSCGGPLRFRGATSIVAVCAYCRSTLVREGARLEDVGKQADLLPDASLLQLGATGYHRGEAFSIVGRIQYRYGAGVWNEWHVLFDRGKGAWLSDANAEHTITYLAPPSPVPAFEALKPGAAVTLVGDPYTVTNLETAEVVAGEGELPFRFGAGWKAPVADLRGPGTRFATIDYSEDVPHVYVGERLPFDTFRFAGLRDPDRPLEPGGRAIAFKCAGCGAPIAKHVAATEVVACGSCGSVTDVTGKAGEIVQRNERNDRAAELTIALGTTGTWRGAKYEVVGALRRAIVVEGETYEWIEYLLHNPSAGYLWISEYESHFSVIKATSEVPRVSSTLLGRPVAHYLGRRFEHFQRAKARVTWLAGEFNWRVKLGDECEVDDFVAPPLILSSETTDREITWSLGEYVEPELLWKAFSLPGKPWTRRGVAPNQPSPHAGRARVYWLVFFAFLLAAILAQFGFMALNAGSRSPAVPFAVQEGGASRTVSPVFEVGGAFAGPVTVRTASSATRGWLGLDLQLTDADTGRAYRLERQLGYRMVGSVRDGSSDDVADIDSLPPGRYTLAIDARAGPPAGQPAETVPSTITGVVHVRREAVGWFNFALLAGFLLLWPLGVWRRERAFEARRWAESDYAPQSGDSSADDD